MSEELLGLIFAIFWFMGVAVTWFYAMFKGYDKVWSEQAVEFQNKFVFFEFHRRVIKTLNSAFIYFSLDWILFSLSSNLRFY